MTRTLLESLNASLLIAGERPLPTSAGTLGDLVKQALKDSVSEISTGNKLEGLRSRINASSWLVDEATLPTDLSYIEGVYFYSSPTGLPGVNFDYPTYNVRYLSPEEYERHILFSFSTTSLATPRFWTKLNYNVCKVNPYPTDAAQRAKVFFDVYRIPQLPATDGAIWSCPDVITDLIQMRTAAMIALRHLQNQDLYQTLYTDYSMLLRHQRNSQSQTPHGYTMYRRDRYRNI